jgi:DNA polymerase
VWDAADDVARNKASKRYERCLVAKDKQKAGILPREVWIACDIVKVAWRQANPRIVAAWEALEDAARDAVRNPGAKFQALGKVSYLFAQGFLWCRLPSGRCIAYAAPRLKDQVWARERLEDGSWAEQAETMDREEAEKLAVIGKVKIDGPTKPKITALGVDSTTQKLVRYPLYGGLYMENLCLAIERDILVHGMRGVEAAGSPVVMHVYDELTAEVPRGFGSLAEVVEIMCRLPAWAEGLPIAAEGWRGKRFRK